MSDKQPNPTNTENGFSYHPPEERDYSNILLLVMVWLVMIATACSAAPSASTIKVTPPAPGISVNKELTSTPVGGIIQLKSVEDIAKIVAQRTPVPTPTPGSVEVLIEEMVDEAGWADRSLLGLSAENWIDLGISILIMILGILLGVQLIFGLVRWSINRSKTQFDDHFLNTIERELKWFVALILARFAIVRLDFWREGLTILLNDIFFLLGLILLYIIFLRLVAFAADLYRDHHVPEENKKRLDPVIIITKRSGYLFISIIVLSIILGHFGISDTLPIAFIVTVGLVIAIASKEAISDLVNGAFILLSHPFRVGDNIHLKEIDTWGLVVEIGLHTTRIRTIDNREVIIPNSLIGNSQVINYSYPDPSLRIKTDIHVAYGTDIDLLQQVIKEAIYGVEGVLPDKPVDVFFLVFGDSALKIRVWWWIDDVNHQNPMLTQVNVVIKRALSEAGIEMPFPTYYLNMKKEKVG